MPVYVDNAQIGFGRMKMSHMIADTYEELHAMAERIGMKREWFQASPPASFPHYDVSISRRKQAIMFGAIEVNMRELVAHMRRLRPILGVYGPGNPAPKPEP